MSDRIEDKRRASRLRTKNHRTKLNVTAVHAEQKNSSSDISDSEEKCDVKKGKIEVNVDDKIEELRREDDQNIDLEDDYKELEKNVSITTQNSADSNCGTEDLLDRFSSGSDCDNSDTSCNESDDECNFFMENMDTGIVLLANDLRKWARDCDIAYKHVDGLLKILKPYHPELPLSSTTLFRSGIKTKFEIEKFNPDNADDNSQFLYCGLALQLQRTVNINLHKNNTLRLQFNIDGLPLFHSSSIQFWPILGKVYTEQNVYNPFVIAVYCGNSKPSNVTSFLSKFVDELNYLLENGIDIDGKSFIIEIMCFICDRPARSLIKCIKNHTGFYSCERCDVRGYRFNNRTLFPLHGGKERDDLSFRSQTNIEHHTGKSPLTLITPPINMISSFSLDFMHLCCLGIMKKLFTDYWLKAGHKCKLNKNNTLRLSARLVNLSNQIPSEFQRTTRALAEISKWTLAQEKTVHFCKFPYI